MDTRRKLAELVRSATATGPVRIRGGNTKSFYGNPSPQDLPVLCTNEHVGVISYRPEELVIRVKAGTKLGEVESILAEQGQHMPFEPPAFGMSSTIGGVVAAGISGSRRPYGGAVRDHLLGVGLIRADGSYQEFGGQVMKNVAGYDVSRLLSGSLGILGVIADVSLKVLPTPAREASLCLRMEMPAALALFNDLRRAGAPLSAAAATGDQVFLRLSGSAGHIERRLQQLEEAYDAIMLGNDYWSSVDTHEALGRAGNLWRLSCPPTESLELAEGCVPDLVDWGGAQRWVTLADDSPRITYSGRGHWTLVRSTVDNPEERFEPLAPAIMQLHRNLKKAFDPAGRFNPGRMYKGL